MIAADPQMTGTPADTQPALSLQGLSRRFGDTHALREVSLDIAEGEFFTIVGPSGSGKTTLLRILAGLDQPTTGTLLLRGKDVTGQPPNKRPTAMVFQSLALFDHRSVGQNVEFALKMRGIDAATRKARALELLDLVRLGPDYYGKAVTQCSGGERQRVALARALASDPEILFFDEPLSALDYRLRKTLEVELRSLQRRTGRTFVYITHSLEEAMVMSDRIGIMKDGQLVQVGTPSDIYDRPRDRFVARFMGEVNILQIRDEHLPELNSPLPGFADGHLILRPEALHTDGQGIGIKVTVQERFQLGSRVQLHLDTPAGLMIAEQPASCALQPGDEAQFHFDPAQAHRVTE
ncbi:ABC transporter ATP-binding protein [Mameliella sp. MMSF_3455]|uniref:ABC transporter ATP-binding protein n=1 Tax=Mameliella sp. MMSF_3455 TaxID=3046714 RepID=UPI00273E8FF6|nr:ABC transporter ATP-binding protein [Mameliella sp. MMSF_3455]